MQGPCIVQMACRLLRRDHSLSQQHVRIPPVPRAPACMLASCAGSRARIQPSFDRSAQGGSGFDGLEGPALPPPFPFLTIINNTHHLAISPITS